MFILWSLGSNKENINKANQALAQTSRRSSELIDAESQQRNSRKSSEEQSKNPKLDYSQLEGDGTKILPAAGKLFIFKSQRI